MRAPARNIASLSRPAADGSAAFMAELRRRLSERGVFRGDRRGYLLRAIHVLGLAGLVWWGLVSVEGWPARLALIVLAGYLGVQASAIAHEAGHGAVTRSRSWQFVVGHVFMTLVMGSAFSVWVERHGAHHRHPNSRHDPDIRPGLFRFNEADARAAIGLAGWCTRRQHWLLFPLATLMAFSLKGAGWLGAVRDPRGKRTDLVLLAAHIVLWLLLPALWIGPGDAAINYLLATWAQGVYLAFVFLPNHLGGPTGEEAAEWPPALRQVAVTGNLPDGWLMTHFCVGLNSHIEHHLYGHLPASRLSEARAVARDLCALHGIPYRQRGLLQAFVEIHRYNRRMAEIARRAQRRRREQAGAA